MSAMAQSHADSTDAEWQFYGQPTRFVGRVKEMHRLRESIRNGIESGTARATLLLGPPGIGKSRLLWEFLDTVDEHVDKITILNVACQLDEGAPYLVFRRLIRDRFYAEADDPKEMALDKVQSGISQVLRDDALGEEAAHFIGHLIGMRYPRSKHILRVDADPRRIEERAIELFRLFVGADARRVPLIIGVDNLHLASEESLRLLLKLSSGLADVPLMFIGAARDHFRDRHRKFTDAIARVGQVIDLPALADRDCTLIVDHLLAAADDVPDGFVRTTCEKAFGNPLSLEQIIQLHIERGAIDTTVTPWKVDRDQLDDTRIPGTLRDLVRTKLSRLEPLERRVLEKASVIGDSFWSGCVGVLRRVDEWHNWDEADRNWSSPRRADELKGVLEGLRRKETILRMHQCPFPPSRAYTFKHTLEREVLYEGIEGPRRARYHRVVAQWLEAQSSDRTDDMVELTAQHWERGHHPRKAAAYYREAGDRAREQYLNAKAAALYGRALECLTEDDAIARMEVFHKLGKVQMIMGNHAEALGYFQEMLRLAWLLDLTRKGGVAYNKMGQSYRALGEYALALEHFKDGLALFRRAEDIRGIAMSVDDIGRVHLFRGEMDRALELYEEGLRLRRYLKDDRAVAVSLHHIGSVHRERGDFRTAVKALREALGLARQVNDRKQVADILNNMGIICYHRGQKERALTVWSEALDIARELGERQLEGMTLNNMGETSLAVGRADEAREQLEAAIAIFEAVGDRHSLADALRNLGDAHLQSNEYAEARAYSERALEAARELGARVYVGLAERNLGEVFSRTIYADDDGRDERISRAEAHFIASRCELEAIGQETELGRTLLAYGSFLAEIGRDEDARDALGRAREIFIRLDMKDALERADRVLSAF